MILASVAAFQIRQTIKMSTSSFLSTCAWTVVSIVLLPVYLVFFLLFLIIWLLLTITLIGPTLQYCYTQRDNDILDISKLSARLPDLRIITMPANVNSASAGRPYKLVASFLEPANPDLSLPPVVLPNGLGATMVVIRTWQEGLVAKGFRVLSFDRLGVGFSDDNPSGRPPTAEDIIREMDHVMNAVLPLDTKWIIAGGSMGSIVGECYISAFPNKVVGFLNMDGLPYPFIKFKPSFLWAAWIYKVYTYIIWTGVFRPAIGSAVAPMEKHLTSQAFALPVFKAQLNQTRFFANIGLEMVSMMHLCEFATAAWGSQSLLDMDPRLLDVRTNTYYLLLLLIPPTTTTITTTATNITTTSSIPIPITLLLLLIFLLFLFLPVKYFLV